MMDASIPLGGLFVGSEQDRWPGRAPSAIGKTRYEGSLDLTSSGFAGDEQADLRVHGGAEKAVHHYPADHYPAWMAELGPNARFAPGGFGENLSTMGLLEDDVCIGDVFRLGEACLQVSQGRQPCWKLSAHTGIERMAYNVQLTARTGWYYRLLEPGMVRPDDALHLAERPQPDWTVGRVTRARFDRRLDPDSARILSTLAELNEGWRASFARRAAGGTEYTSKRLDG